MSRARGLLATAVLAATYCALTGAPSATAQPSAARPWAGSVVATRSYLDANGRSHETDHRTISLHVSQTSQLRGRQEINVSWSGAHPTGGTVADVNSGDGAAQEYPFVLLECRGVDSASAGKDRLSPQTCWTQTWSERFQKDNTTGYPAWRSDRYESAADRAASVDAPDPRPAACFRAALAERWLPFVAANGTTYPGGSVGCAGMAPESANVSGAGIPSNTTYGITGKDGTGTADFDVWTNDENASLGCSDTVPCALVAVPIEGISCDAYGTELGAAQRPPDRVTAGADGDCRAGGAYQPGQAFDPGDPTTASVTGALWWSASNWRNRITVPLSFAVPASVCSVVSSAKPVTIYGSVLMSELSAQWEPTFCTDTSLYPFVHVQTSDEAARNLLNTGSIDAAFTSRPPNGGYGRPVVQAPVAMTGFAISYAIDDADGNHYSKLRLDARLIAKLLTESYPADALVRDNYPAIAHNPMNITQDPEFIALNPGLPHYNVNESAAVLSMLSSDADLTHALTSYLNSDPEARAWLNGQPDPWGMVVNPNYLGIDLPLESWPLLDDFTLPQSYIAAGDNPCYSYSPSPFLQLIANPSSLLSTIVQNLQFAVSNVDIGCPNGVAGDIPSLRLSVQGRQQPGHRFVLGVTSVSAARRYDLDTAKLQTTLAHPDLHAQFTDASGRSFVADDDAGMRAAAALVQADSSTHAWTLDSAVLARHPGAYPGTMTVYADVPTIGLSKATAGRLSTLLHYAATDGQQPGIANGQLPAGYLPLSKANGLAELADYTDRASQAVAAQRGAVPPLHAPNLPPPTSSSTAPGPHSTSAANPSAPNVPGGNGPVPNGPAPQGVGNGSAPDPSATSGAVPPASGAPTASGSPGSVGIRSVASYSRLGSLVLPIALALGLLCGLVGSLLRYRTAVQTVLVGTRRVLRRGPPGRRRQ